MPAAVAPSPGRASLTISTSRPSSAAAQATAAPTMPAPTTITSALRPKLIRSLRRAASRRLSAPSGGSERSERGGSRDSPAERIGRIEQQRRLAADMRAAGDGRQHFAIAAPAVRGLEHAADHALLPPHGAGRELAVGRQAGQLGAGAGAAGRAVVGLAGTEHEAAAVGP